MAIKKIIGKVDGSEIIFRKDSSGLWSATVPKDMGGEYVVEIKAYDEAGNYAYSASMLFIVDPSTLEVKFIPLQYSYRFLDKNYNKKMIAQEFAYREVVSSFRSKVLPHNFTAKVVS